MGRVFTWSEVRNGHYPKLKSFEVVKDLLISQLSSMPEVLGGAICGSVLTGNVTRRSDVDVVIVYDRPARDSFIPRLGRLLANASALYVPVEPILLDQHLGQTENHGIYRSFWIHLGNSAPLGGIIKRDPRELILMPSLDFKSETAHYIARKRASLEKRWAKLYPGSPDRCGLLEKTLAAPIHTARKMIRCYDKNLLTDGDSKDRVLKIYTDIFSGQMSAQLLSEICETDWWYTKTLQDHFRNAKRDSYEELLSQLESMIPHTLDFLLRNLLILDEWKQTQK